jgi:hypothetical protein
MAGIKITELPSLSTAASDDVLYIVDTSTNTSKKIEVGNIVSLESGTWTPTITTDYQSSTLFKAIYSKVGNCVNFIIDFGLSNLISPILFGDTYFTPPNGLTPSTNLLGIMSFRFDIADKNALAAAYTIGTDGTSIICSLTNSAASVGYRITIQGTYLIA